MNRARAGVLLNPYSKTYEVINEKNGKVIASTDLNIKNPAKVIKKLRHIEKIYNIRIVNLVNLTRFLQYSIYPELQWKPEPKRPFFLQPFQQARDLLKEQQIIDDELKRRQQFM